jgi:hypothetical protein
MFLKKIKLNVLLSNVFSYLCVSLYVSFGCICSMFDFCLFFYFYFNVGPCKL